MIGCGASLTLLSQYLNEVEIDEVIHLAKKAQTLEQKWRAKADQFFNKISDKIAEDIVNRMNIDENSIDFETLFVEHAFDVMFDGVKSAQKRPAIPARLAYPKSPMPRSLKALMQLWDLWRNKKKAPPRQKALANKIKKAYIRKAQQVVSKYETRARRGDVIEKQEVLSDLREQTKAPSARVNTIINTETTRYWNQARRNVYDESQDITHYLFLAIRDAATTKWCKTRNGLIYAKGDPILSRETPPIHWNCRSEILPLTPKNPRHKKLIDDELLRRRNHSPEPLPPGWNG